MAGLYDSLFAPAATPPDSTSHSSSNATTHSAEPAHAGLGSQQSPMPDDKATSPEQAESADCRKSQLQALALRQLRRRAALAAQTPSVAKPEAFAAAVKSQNSDTDVLAEPARKRKTYPAPVVQRYDPFAPNDYMADWLPLKKQRNLLEEDERDDDDSEEAKDAENDEEAKEHKQQQRQGKPQQRAEHGRRNRAQMFAPPQVY